MWCKIELLGDADRGERVEDFQMLYHTKLRLFSYMQWVGYIAFLAALLLVARSIPG